MKLFAIVTILAGVISALPEPVSDGDAAKSLDKRDCVNCVTYCCKQAGGCNYLHCDGSKCITDQYNHSYCKCNCRYG